MSGSDTNVAPSSIFSIFSHLNIKECMAASISLGIGIVSLWMLVATYNYASVSRITGDKAAGQTAVGEQFDENSFNRRKDILMLSLGLLGTVTGYYLGRVPAERQADAAREQADAANAVAASAEDSKRNVKQAVLDAAASVAQDDASGGTGGSSASKALFELEKKIRNM